jgi:hypothetical protein
MLTTSRPAGSYRTVASAVRTRLLDAQANDEPQRPLSPMMGERIDTIRDLLQLGYQYGPRPDNQLDTSAGSTPAKLDLARELYDLVPRQLERYGEGREFDMREWVREAVGLLDGLKGRIVWSELGEKKRDFAESEFLPFLERLLSTPPQVPDW